MAVVELNDGNFSETVENNELVVLDFWAPWCGPCRSFAPIFEEASENHPDVIFGKINTEEEQKLSAYFGIRSIPTLIFIREGIVLEQVGGAIPSDVLDRAVRAAKELDMAKVHEEIEKEERG